MAKSLKFQAPTSMGTRITPLFNQNVADMDFSAYSSKVRVFISEMCDL